MSISDTLDYITLRNPLSRMVISSGSALMRTIGLKPKQAANGVATDVVALTNNTNAVSARIVDVSLSELSGGYYNFIRLGGISGALAIIMGAYCKYHLREIKDPNKQLEVQTLSDVANRIHFLHSFMLVAVPLVHYPMMTGSLIVLGTTLFSGSMYYRALTDDKSMQHFATTGGFLLIAAWLSIVF